MNSIAKSTMAFAVSGQLAQALRPEEEGEELLVAAKQQSMEESRSISESQRTNNTGTVFSEEYAKLLSEIEVHLDQQSEAKCGDDAKASASAKASLAELSADSLFYASMAVGSSHKKSIAEHMQEAMSQVPDKAKLVIANWAHEKLKPTLKRNVVKLASKKHLKKAFQSLYHLVSDEDTDLQALKTLLNDALNKTNAAAEAKGSFEKLSFNPPLELHLRDGTPVEAIRGVRVGDGKWTADSQTKALHAYKIELNHVKQKEDGNTDTGYCVSCWFSHGIRKSFKEKSITNFFQKYADAILDDGNFRSTHLQAIEAHLGISWADRKQHGIMAHYGLDMLRELSAAHHKAAEKDIQKMESPQESQDQQNLLARMKASGQNPLKLFIEMADALEKTAEEKGETMSEEDEDVRKFVDDLPIAVGWLLNHDNFNDGLKKLIADTAQYMARFPVQPQLEQGHADGASVIELGPDLTLAPDQMKMAQCQTTRLMKTALMQLSPKPHGRERSCCAECCDCCSDCCANIDPLSILLCCWVFKLFE